MQAGVNTAGVNTAGAETSATRYARLFENSCDGKVLCRLRVQRAELRNENYCEVLGVSGL